ncbi:hypothetical protein PENTCL1PPCAC_3960, partial [Pristionchus entomophagus]
RQESRLSLTNSSDSDDDDSKIGFWDFLAEEGPASACESDAESSAIGFWDFIMEEGPGVVEEEKVTSICSLPMRLLRIIRKWWRRYLERCNSFIRRCF